MTVRSSFLQSMSQAITVNESYTSNSVEPRPIAWYIDPPSTSQPLQEGAIKAGRSFYTASGHSNGSKLNISE
ncbi:hypothetical protein I203_103420 [Kwoniella mangroviensis CBS 8507]|uniref:uncharacterized protein n=1 Tax=Kwoniella mangroviensis CBS 8507 TaxID=1296122 RepID=UPI00306EC5C5